MQGTAVVKGPPILTPKGSTTVGRAASTVIIAAPTALPKLSGTSTMCTVTTPRTGHKQTKNDLSYHRGIIVDVNLNYIIYKILML